MPLQIINAKDRERLNSFPELITSEDLRNYYKLSEQDLSEAQKQRGDHNQFGFALQLGSLRHLGFIPGDLLTPPDDIRHFVADQLGVAPTSLAHYRRQATQSNHLQQITAYTGFRRVAPLDTIALGDWLSERALEHDKPLLLFELACDYLYKRKLLRPGITLLEQTISDARAKASLLTYQKLAPLLTSDVKRFLTKVLDVIEGERYTTLSWLQATPTDPNPTQIKTVLAKIDVLQDAGVGDWDVTPINPNRFKWLAKVGAKISKQNLLNSSAERRASLLIAFLHSSLYSYTDDVIGMFDQRIWELYGKAKNMFEVQRRRAQATINENLGILQQLGEVLLDESLAEADVRVTAFSLINRQALHSKLQENKTLLRPQNDAFVDYFRMFYQSVRNVAKPLLASLSFEVWNEDQGLMAALDFVREIHADKRSRIPKSAPTAFVPKNWLGYLWVDGEIDRHYYELAAIWVLREKLRSGDVYVKHSRRYAPVESYLIPRQLWSQQRHLVIELTGTPSEARTRLEQRKADLVRLCTRAEAALTATPAELSVTQGQLIAMADQPEPTDPRIDRFKRAVRASLTPVDITDVMLAVDKATGFSQTLEHRSGSRQDPDMLSFYACILAQGCNLGFAYMARSSGLDYHALRAYSDAYLTEDNLKNALTILVDQHHALPFSDRWGSGMLSSSDGQRFPMTRTGKTLRARHNPRYFGLHKGVTFYTWTSDQFSQYGSKAIPATVRDATYVLDAVLDNETELTLLEHTTDTSGYSELIFAVFDLLGLQFIPRIRDLKRQTLYRTKDLDLTTIPNLAPCLTGVIQEAAIEPYWDEMLRFVGSLKLGYVTASLVIQKLQAYPRKHQLTRALQAYGRLPKTLHILNWYTQPGLRKRAGLQLNKGEAMHDLRAYIAFANQGKIGTRTDEQLDHQVACLNLLTNIVIYWNTLSLQAAVDKLVDQGYPVQDEDVKHLWPTRYQHVNVYGKYSFDHQGIEALCNQRRLSGGSGA